VRWRVAKLLFPCFRQCDTLDDLLAGTLRRIDDGYGAIILLGDYLGALLDLRQHGVDIAGEFGLL
jgi:hypothetical protein